MVTEPDVDAWSTIDGAPQNQRVLIQGYNHVGADEMAMAWLDRIDNRWYYAPQGGLVQWTPTHWREIPEGVQCKDPKAIELAAANANLPKRFTWPPKACPCGSGQCEECQEEGCRWTRNPSLVPENLRQPLRGCPGV